MLLHPQVRWNVLSVCRASDSDRAPRFRRALEELGATGSIADLDDSPDQQPLPDREVQDVVSTLLGNTSYDLLITHAPRGEYTRHLRHEEVSRAVASLWESGRASARQMWMFAYEDDNGSRLPQAVRAAHVKFPLRSAIWEQKYWIVTEVYGFSPESWEARATPHWEAFWCFESPSQLGRWLQREKNHESLSAV